MAEEYKTTRQVADMFGVDERTIRRWLLEEPPRFPNAFRTRQGHGAPWLIPMRDVQAELKRQGKK